MPVRVQRKRIKGWKMPPDTVCVTRGTRWGNIFIIDPAVSECGRTGIAYYSVPTLEVSLECFRNYIGYAFDLKELIKKELRGKNLACFCQLDKPCHADILLEIANE